MTTDQPTSKADEALHAIDQIANLARPTTTTPPALGAVQERTATQLAQHYGLDLDTARQVVTIDAAASTLRQLIVSVMFAEFGAQIARAMSGGAR